MLVTAGLLYVLVDPPEGMAVRFDRWQEAHAGARTVVPGIDRIRRYDAIEGAPRYMVRYDLADVSVTDSEEYRTLRTNRTDEDEVILGRVPTMDRRVYRELASGTSVDQDVWAESRYLLAIGMTTAEPGAVDEWYLQEHVPMLSGIAGWVSSRRYVKTEGSGPAYLVLHDLTTLDLFGSAYEAASATPRAREIREGCDAYARHVYRLLREWVPVDPRA